MKGATDPAGVGLPADWFEIAPNCLAAGAADPIRAVRGAPQVRPLRLFALDPSARRVEGAVAVASIPYEPLAPGPVGRVLEVFDYDTDQDRLYAPVDLDDRVALLGQGFTPSVANFRFHQQMAYAVAMQTWHAFRSALGRDPCWAVGSDGKARPRLRIRPHAFEQANAWFDPASGELQFGYYRSGPEVGGRNQPGGWVFTCLSHDVLAHETAHALLDGLRPHFLTPSNPDVLAFHEAFCDLVAIFLKFSYPDLIRNAIARTPQKPLTDRLLAGLAEQFGQTTLGEDRPLRTGIELADPDQSGSIQRYDPSLEPHALGRVLVSAIFEAFINVFERKTQRYRRLLERYRAPGAPLDPDVEQLLAEHAAKLAQQFLTICIRAVDYCPPVDITFGDYLRALITADHDLVPEDPDGYRDALIDAFARRRICAKDVINLAEDVLLWDQPPDTLPPIADLSFARLQFGGDPGHAPEARELRTQATALGRYATEHADLFRILRPNAPELGPDRVDPPVVTSVRTLRRVAPHRDVSFELVAEIVQRRHFAAPNGGPAFLMGGCTVVIGADGRIRYVIHKSLTSRTRAPEQDRYARIQVGQFWQACKGRLLPTPFALRALHAGRRP